MFLLYKDYKGSPLIWKPTCNFNCRLVALQPDSDQTGDKTDVRHTKKSKTGYSDPDPRPQPRLPHLIHISAARPAAWIPINSKSKAAFILTDRQSCLFALCSDKCLLIDVRAELETQKQIFLLLFLVLGFYETLNFLLGSLQHFYSYGWETEEVERRGKNYNIFLLGLSYHILSKCII